MRGKLQIEAFPGVTASSKHYSLSQSMIVSCVRLKSTNFTIRAKIQGTHLKLKENLCRLSGCQTNALNML